jgi:plastocyanin
MVRPASMYLTLSSATLLAAGCGGGGGGSEPPPGDMTTVSKTATASGDAQNGTVGQPLASPLQVIVTQNGTAASGVSVAWSTSITGGTLTPPTASTNADGVASSAWLLGNAAGAQTARATVTGAAGSPVTFNATAAAGAAATLADAGGNGQTGEINTQLALPLRARVTDLFGNPIAGTSVNWTVDAGDATTSAPTAASDATGISQVTVQLGPTAGPITIVAESGVLTGSPLTFTETSVPPAPTPTSISITVGNDFFSSNRNQSTSPAVDTVAVGGEATWTWVSTGTVTHNVTPTGSPILTGSGNQQQPFSHSFTFTAPGTYRYYCSLHAISTATTGMVGRIVVQ